MYVFFFFSSRRRHTRYWRDWSSDVCSSDLLHVDLRGLPAVDALAARVDAPHPVAVAAARAVIAERRAELLAGGNGEDDLERRRSEERRVGKECRYRWSPDH